MSSLRRVCIVATAAPVVVFAACVDLGNLSTPPAGDGGGIEVEGEGGPPEAKCAAGQKSCAGGCVPNDLPEYGCAAASCERCSVPFADKVICESGKCAVGTCQSGRGSCDGNKANGCEADLTLATTCGSCTTSCPVAARFCNAGQCVKDCAPLTACGDQCVDLAKNATHCGSCEISCPGANNATGVCIDSKCAIKCAVGFGDCDGNPANGCEPLQPYYVDGDNDGVGGGTKVGEACTAPAGNSLVPGDCLDANDKVKPGQTTFFAIGYTNASGKLSYDYDCNGTEQREPTKPAGDCSTCRVGDYVTVSRANAPPNADYHCGSGQTIAACSGSSSCSATSSASSGLACR